MSLNPHFERTRPPIDVFEVALVNAYAESSMVDAIWVRDVQCPVQMTAYGPKHFVRCVWLQLSRLPRSLHEFESRANELAVRALREPFQLEVHFVVDDLPAMEAAPSCVYRRAPAVKIPC